MLHVSRELVHFKDAILSDRRRLYMRYQTPRPRTHAATPTLARSDIERTCPHPVFGRMAGSAPRVTRISTGQGVQRLTVGPWCLPEHDEQPSHDRTHCRTARHTAASCSHQDVPVWRRRDAKCRRITTAQDVATGHRSFHTRTGAL